MILFIINILYNIRIVNIKLYIYSYYKLSQGNITVIKNVIIIKQKHSIIIIIIQKIIIFLNNCTINIYYTYLFYNNKVLKSSLYLLQLHSIRYYSLKLLNHRYIKGNCTYLHKEQVKLLQK